MPVGYKDRDIKDSYQDIRRHRNKALDCVGIRDKMVGRNQIERRTGMNPYDNATITVKKFAVKGDRIYGELRDSEGELLVSASLEYITKILEERMTKIEEKKMEFKDKTNEELIELYNKQANKMSFFNAAEGASWYAEATERQVCQGELKAIREEFVARSLDFPQGNWLL